IERVESGKLVLSAVDAHDSRPADVDDAHLAPGQKEFAARLLYVFQHDRRSRRNTPDGHPVKIGEVPEQLPAGRKYLIDQKRSAQSLRRQKFDRLTLRGGQKLV